MRIEFPDINFHSTNKSRIMEWRAPLFWVLPPQDRDIGSNFWQFYVIKTSFTLGEPVSFMKVFRQFRLERIVLVFRVWTEYIDVQHLLYYQDQRVCDALLFCGWKETCQVHIPTSLFRSSSPSSAAYCLSGEVFSSISACLPQFSDCFSISIQWQGSVGNREIYQGSLILWVHCNFLWNFLAFFSAYPWLKIHLNVIFYMIIPHNINTWATLKKKVRNSNHYIKRCARTALGGPIQPPISSIQAHLW
jgi:hypothetical protein